MNYFLYKLLHYLVMDISCGIVYVMFTMQILLYTYICLCHTHLCHFLFNLCSFTGINAWNKISSLFTWMYLENSLQSGTFIIRISNCRKISNQIQLNTCQNIHILSLNVTRENWDASYFSHLYNKCVKNAVPERCRPSNQCASPTSDLFTAPQMKGAEYYNCYCFPFPYWIFGVVKSTFFNP